MMVLKRVERKSRTPERGDLRKKWRQSGGGEAGVGGGMLLGRELKNAAQSGYVVKYVQESIIRRETEYIYWSIGDIPIQVSKEAGRLPSGNSRQTFVKGDVAAEIERQSGPTERYFGL